MKLQSILFPRKSTCDDQAMYFHQKDNCLIFDGYFNLFYLEKHHKYCDINGLSLELIVSGVRRIVLMHDLDEIETCDIDKASATDEADSAYKVRDKQRVSIEFPYDKYENGVFYFKAEIDCPDTDALENFNTEEKDCTFHASIIGHYEASVTNAYRPVNIAVNICTFKREPYVCRNMKALQAFFEDKDIDGKLHEVADHLKFFIIDNGQSLQDNDEFTSIISDVNSKRQIEDYSDIGLQNNSEASASESSIITVIPNANTGGTGGFSRGMIEAMNRKDELKLSHLLMMDDDAVFDPDLFVRLYGFLSVLKKEYFDITVGGALLREDYRYIQHAAGEWFTNFKVINDHPLADMRTFDTCTSDWMTGTDREHELYGAWWCCCYHMDAITKKNLPLPIFVHHDDIQFGMRQVKRGIVFLNGICVWHQGFETSFPGVKQYYNMRNTLITMRMFEPEVLKKRIWIWTLRRYTGMLINLRYADCEFIYRGFMDFFKGKKWLLSTDPEALHKELMAEYKRLCPLSELPPDYKYLEHYAEKLSPDELRKYYDSSRFNGPLYKKITFNGWFLPAKKGVKVITPLDSPWETFRYKKIFLYEPSSGRGVFVQRDGKELVKAISRLWKMHLKTRKWKSRTNKREYE